MGEKLDSVRAHRRRHPRKREKLQTDKSSNKSIIELYREVTNPPKK